MIRSLRTLVLTMALIAINPVPARAEVKLAKELGGAVTIKTGIYAAAFDAKGNLLHVTVKDAVAFSHTFGNDVSHLVRLRD
jgi:hypothetical protein